MPGTGMPVSQWTFAQGAHMKPDGSSPKRQYARSPPFSSCLWRRLASSHHEFAVHFGDFPDQSSFVGNAVQTFDLGMFTLVISRRENAPSHTTCDVYLNRSASSETSGSVDVVYRLAQRGDFSHHIGHFAGLFCAVRASMMVSGFGFFFWRSQSYSLSLLGYKPTRAPYRGICRTVTSRSNAAAR